MLTIDFSRLSVKAGTKILDLGCGEGRHALGAMYAFSEALIVGVDIGLNDLQTAVTRKQEIPAKSQCYFSQADGLQLPFADGCFDLVICSEVLEHIPDYQSMLEEARRVLTPGGQLVISVPRYWPEKICWYLEKSYYQVEGGHIRIFRYKDLKRTVKNLSFIFEGRHWAHALHVPFWWLRCLFWRKGEQFILVRLYHKILVWDLFHKPWLTQTLDKLLNPLMGKSVVLYFRRPKN